MDGWPLWAVLGSHLQAFARSASGRCYLVFLGRELAAGFGREKALRTVLNFRGEMGGGYKLSAGSIQSVSWSVRYQCETHAEWVAPRPLHAVTIPCVIKTPQYPIKKLLPESLGISCPS